MRRGPILLHGFIAVRDLKLVSQSENDFKSSRILKLWNNIRFLIPEFLGSTKITETEPKFRKTFCSVTSDFMRNFAQRFNEIGRKESTLFIFKFLKKELR